jgi:solute carrier family 25 uncoupling protein 8/9
MRRPMPRLTSSPARSGLFGTVMTIGREEGAAALWKGLEPGEHAPAWLEERSGAGSRWAGPCRCPCKHPPCISPGLHRQVVNGGLRIGLYEPVRNFYVGKDHKGDIPLHIKIAAGLTTGAIGITVASPTDLVKVGESL